MTRIWAGCLSLLKSSVTQVGLEGPGVGGWGYGGRGESRGIGGGRVKSGPGGGWMGISLDRR